MTKQPRATLSYTCRDQEGNLLETVGCAPETPPTVVLGEGALLPALERVLMQMVPGETREVTLRPAQAFGRVDSSLFYEIPFEQLDLDEEPAIGMVLELTENDGETNPGTIVEITDSSVLVDCNHPLAGKTLVFRLTLHDRT